MVKNAVIEKKPASIFKRGFAYIIDVLIIDLIIVLPFNKTIKNLQGTDTFNFYYNFQYLLDNPEKTAQLAFIGIIVAVLSIAYWTILEFRLRQSIGKILMNIKVMSKKKGFSITQCLVRNISKAITLLFLFDVIYLLINKDKNQRYFEKISDTIVIEEVIKI
ncbi:RDD family protein [Candidatus Woesearchaeota archaeon]|nr:RDD family protein [Candidatus Woesearchaeota archaeon]